MCRRRRPPPAERRYSHRPPLRAVFEALQLCPVESFEISVVDALPLRRVAPVAHLHGHGTHLEFIQYLVPAGDDVTGPPNRPGTAHVAFVVHDIEALAQRMLEAGASEQGRITRCTSGAAAGCLAVYLKDPNGIIVELVEVAAGNVRNRKLPA